MTELSNSVRTMTGNKTGIQCIKCSGFLTLDKDSVNDNGGALCITCGFIDYSFFKMKKLDVSSEGMFYLVYYTGKFSHLQGKVLKTRIQKGSMNRFEAKCPFCSGSDWIEEYSGARKNNARRYACPESHSFHVYLDIKNDVLNLGWD